MDGEANAAPATSRSALNTLFSRLRQLRLLRTERMDIAPVLQGMLDAGAPSLPLLARVVIHDGCLTGLGSVDLLRQFLHRFPLVTVRFETSIPRPNSSPLAVMFAGWPRECPASSGACGSACAASL